MRDGVLEIIAFVVALLILAAMQGCARPPITHEHVTAFDAAEHGWYLAGLPDPGGCLDGARVESAATRDEFDTRCRNYSGAGKPAACLARYTRGMFGNRDGYLVLLAPGQAADAYTIVHESLHALVQCTGVSAYPDLFDAHHRDKRIWYAAGGVQSAQWLSGARL